MVNALSQKKDKFLETWDRAKRLENWLFSTTAQELPRLKVKWDGGGSREKTSSCDNSNAVVVKNSNCFSLLFFSLNKRFTMGDRSPDFPNNHDENWSYETGGTHGVLKKVNPPCDIMVVLTKHYRIRSDDTSKFS
jgi:hypothetical protein